MINKKLAILFLCIFLTSVVLAQQKTVSFYSSDTCPHCQRVKDSGVIQTTSNSLGIDITTYTIQTEEGYNAYYEMKRNNPQIPEGVPLIVIECGDKTSYLIGDTPIIENLGDAINACGEGEYSGSSSSNLPIFIILIVGVIGIIFYFQNKK